MNWTLLVRNYVRGAEICRGFPDRIKYLAWLYGRSLSPNDRRGTVKLRFCLPPPMGDVTLNVRPNGGSDAFIFSEVFEHRYYDFDLPATPTTVLDLGANIGLTALFFARKYPAAQIACVEPMPGNLNLLRANLGDNEVSARVLPKAISVQDRPVVMRIAANDYGHKVADITYGRPMDGDTLQVDGISVPTLLSELGWERIGLLKVDIEGYEGVLLREHCGWLEQVDALCIECHEGYGEDDLRAVAQRFGFDPPQILAGTALLVRNRRGGTPGRSTVTDVSV